jgi:riboflavin synthase
VFTGIVKELGTVTGMTRSGGLYRLDVDARGISRGMNIGDSAAVNGVCLTVVGNVGGVLSFDVMKETVSKTSLDGLRNGSRVNLEDSLRAGAPIGGHFVLGHVDTTGRIGKIVRDDGNCMISIECDKNFAGLLVEKGSVAVDGISLTVGGVAGSEFKVYLIPHTMKITALDSKKAGDIVNIEFDVLGKYVSKFIENGRKGRTLTEEFLRYILPEALRKGGLRMKKLVIVGLILMFMLSFIADGRCDTAVKKLGRGISNAFTCFMEVPDQMTNVGNTDGPVAGWTYGILKGVCMTVVRGVVGVYEVATFPIPLPKGYKPILTNPEFYLEGLSW